FIAQTTLKRLFLGYRMTSFRFYFRTHRKFIDRPPLPISMSYSVGILTVVRSAFPAGFRLRLDQSEQAHPSFRCGSIARQRLRCIICKWANDRPGGAALAHGGCTTGIRCPKLRPLRCSILRRTPVKKFAHGLRTNELQRASISSRAAAFAKAK